MNLPSSLADIDLLIADLLARSAIAGASQNTADQQTFLSAIHCARVTRVVIEHGFAPELVLAASFENIEPQRQSMEWVLVENAGTDDQDIVGEYATFTAAIKGRREWGTGDVMKRLASGRLTTEF